MTLYQVYLKTIFQICEPYQSILEKYEGGILIFSVQLPREREKPSRGK